MNVTPKASEAVTVAVDLAKEVFQLSFADASLRVLARKRLSRSAFAREFENRVPLHAVMEACGSAHYWARRVQRLGHRVTLLPAHQVRPYVLRRKSDRTDADGLLEALRCEGLRPVPVKTSEQQGIQGLHRIREHHKAQRTAAMQAIEVSLLEFNDRDTCSQRLQQAGGVGLLIATALSASYLGLAPREYSSGNTRKLGRITKRGDTYLRTLLIHGARANLRSALLARKRGAELDRTQVWALQLAERVGHNKAAVALANKTARRLWAAEHHRTAFDPNQISPRPAAAAH